MGKWHFRGWETSILQVMALKALCHDIRAIFSKLVSHVT